MSENNRPLEGELAGIEERFPDGTLKAYHAVLGPVVDAWKISAPLDPWVVAGIHRRGLLVADVARMMGVDLATGKDRTGVVRMCVHGATADGSPCSQCDAVRRS